MARPPEQRPEAAALIARIDGSRQRLGHHVVDLRRKLDVPAHLKRSVTSHPFAWFGGSLGIGLIFSRLLRRPRKVVRSKGKGWAAWLLGALFTVFKPAIRDILVDQLKQRFSPGRKTAAPIREPETQLPLSKS